MQTPPSPRILAITPTFHPDQKSPLDQLGFTPYVQAITTFLEQSHPSLPLTLSIEGDWGAGKSSFMIQLRTALADKGYQTIWFDAWRNEKADALWASFALDFIRQASERRRVLFASWRLWYRRVSNSDRPGAAWMMRIQLWTDILLTFAPIPVAIAAWWYLRSVSPGLWPSLAKASPSSVPQLKSALEWGVKVVPWLAAVVQVVQLLRAAFSNVLALDLKKYVRDPNYAEQQTLLNRFHEDFAHLVDVYGGKKPVCVFIDDLDRCDPLKAAELMQAITLMITDNPRLVFILGMDRAKVAAGFALKHKDLIPYLSQLEGNGETAKPASNASRQGLEFGFSFMEKFIQVPFQLPRPTAADLRRMVLPPVPGSRERSESKLKNLWDKVTTLAPVIGLLTARKDPPTAPETPLSAAATVQGNDPSSAASEKRVRDLTIQLRPGSPDMEELVDMAVRFLDSNPRRVKQFVNLLRLWAYIAEKTGLFHEVTAPDGQVRKSLTLPQLAKFVIIALRWPTLINDLRLTPSLLKDLHDQAILGTGTVSEPYAHWLQRKDLMDLLKWQSELLVGADWSQIRAYSLGEAVVNSLLRVWPEVKPEAALTPVDVTVLADTAQALTSHETPAALRAQGDALSREGKPVEAEQRYNRGLELAGNTESLEHAHLLLSKGLLFMRWGKPEEASFMFNKALAIYEAQDNAKGIANTLRFQGDLATQRGYKAGNVYDRALQLYMETGDRQGQANVLTALGVLAARDSKPAQAEERFRRAVALFREINDLDGEGEALVNRGQFLLQLKHWEDAATDFDRATNLFEQTGNRLGSANARFGLAQVHYHTSDLDRAEALLTRAQHDYEFAGNVRGVANVLQLLADVYTSQKRFDPAERTLRNALDLYVKLEDPIGEANTQASLGQVLQATDKPELAIAALQRARNLYTRLGMGYTSARKEVVKRLRSLGQEIQDPDEDAPF